MRITKRRVGATLVFDLAGHLDTNTAAEFFSVVEFSLPPFEPRVLFNLEKIAFLDSTGLSAMMQSMKRCRERGGHLGLYNLPRPVQAIFELTRLDRAFYIFSSEAEALEKLGKSE